MRKDLSPGPLIAKGSSKDLYWLEKRPGHVLFDFSDRVSVFDYGALPDTIPGKGAALERSANVFFGWLQEAGLKTAHAPEVSKEFDSCVLRWASHPKFENPVTSGVQAELRFIPLEVIFRWGVPAGSSLLKRDPTLRPNQRFPEPRVEFSTKLESTDRFVNWSEAAELAGSAETLKKLEAYAADCARLLQQKLKVCGLDLWDGKIECATDAKGEIYLVDALTPDELRVTLPGLESVPLSKELLRQWIGSTNWAFRVQLAKRRLGKDWKRDIPSPPRLGLWRLQKLTGLYTAFADALEQNSSAPLFAWLRDDSLKPRVFVMGSGGREEALRWRLRQEGCQIAPNSEEADCTWISMDSDLASGTVDGLDSVGCWTYGPTRAASKAEWSKEYGRELAAKAGVRVPRFTSDPTKLRAFDKPPVVKCDGLAGGKGVVVPETWDEATAALRVALEKGKVVLEERLSGFEASAFFAVNAGYSGVKTAFLGCARDFKRRFAGDKGPNTGGMGSYAPHPEIKEEDIALFSKWAQATAELLSHDGTPYNGIIYLGIMKDPEQGWVLIEYNARFGDPETQALVMAWPSKSVLRPLLQLDVQPFRGLSPAEFLGGPLCICLALVRAEYPGTAPELSLPEWKPEGENFQLFRAGGTKGRVAYLVGRGRSLHEAGDVIFERLVNSPWKGILEWRADLIP